MAENNDIISTESFTTFAELIGEDVIDDLPDDYEDLKTFLHKVNVYGSPQFPLFRAREIKDALIKKENFHKRDFNNDILPMFVETTIQMGKQRRKVMFFTDHGINEVLFLNRGKNSRQFRCFVSIALKALFLKKEVTLDEVVAEAKFNSENKELVRTEYEVEVGRLTKKIQKLNGQLLRNQLEYEDESDRVEELESINANLKTSVAVGDKQVSVLTKKIKIVEDNYDPYNPPADRVVQLLKQNHWNCVYIYLLPCDIGVDLMTSGKSFDYDNKIDSDLIDDSEMMLYAINKNSENKSLINASARVVCEVYLPKPIDKYIVQLRQYIKSVVIPSTYTFKNIIIYDITLNVIKTSVEQVAMNYLQKDDWNKTLSRFKKSSYSDRWS